MENKPRWQNANLWTLVHLISMPFAVTFIILGMWKWTLGAVLVSLICDVGDGLIARRFGTESSYGRKFDPMTDAVVRTSIFLAMAYADLFDRPWAYMVIIFPVRDLLVSFSRQMKWNDGARQSGKWKARIQTTAQIGIGLGMAISIPHVRDINLAWMLLAGFVTVWSCHDYMPWRVLSMAIIHSRHAAAHITYLMLWGVFSSMLLVQLWWVACGTGVILSSIYYLYRHKQHTTDFGRRFRAFVPIIMSSMSFLLLALNGTITSYDAALTLVPIIVGFLLSFNRQVKTEEWDAEWHIRSYGGIFLLLLTVMSMVFAINIQMTSVVSLLGALIVAISLFTAHRVTRLTQHWRYIMRTENLV